MRRSVFLGLALCAVISGSSAISAVPIGQWAMEDQGDGLCVIFRRYADNGATLFLGLKGNGEVTVGAGKAGWSAEEGKSYQMNLVIGGKVFAGAAKGIGGDGADGPGIVGGFAQNVLEAVSRSSDLVMFLAEDPLEAFALTGSSSAVAGLRKCAVESAATVQRNARRKAMIPSDPFKPSKP